MANFLKNIAARMDGLERLLRPRVAPLFEPAPTASPLVPPSDDPRAAIGSLTRDGPTLDRRRDPGPGVMRDDPMRGASSRDPLSAQPFAEPKPSARHKEAARDMSRNPSMTIRPAGVAPRTPSVPLRQPQPNDAVEQMGSPRADVRRDSGRIPARRSDASISVGIAAEDGKSVSASLNRAPPPVRGILQAPAIAGIIAPPHSSGPRSSTHSSGPRTSTGESAIQVTIGRVEIRAVAGSALESARAERPSPVMSLDEYLRTRTR